MGFLCQLNHFLRKTNDLKFNVLEVMARFFTEILVHDLYISS